MLVSFIHDDFMMISGFRSFSGLPHRRTGSGCRSCSSCWIGRAALDETISPQLQGRIFAENPDLLFKHAWRDQDTCSRKRRSSPGTRTLGCRTTFGRLSGKGMGDDRTRCRSIVRLLNTKKTASGEGCGLLRNEGVSSGNEGLQRINAWRTGSACGHRVGRTSCAPSCVGRGSGSRGA